MDTAENVVTRWPCWRWVHVGYRYGKPVLRWTFL